MNYYVVSCDTGQILERYSSYPDVQKEADRFGCAVYVIVGEHAGLSAVPTTPPPPPDAKTG